MFVDAIEKVMNYTRPIMFIMRDYQSTNVIPGLATMFFINNEGCAITCKHVARLIGEADNINKKYMEYKNEAEVIRKNNPKGAKKELKFLEHKYGYKKGETVNTKVKFIGVPSGFNKIDIQVDPDFDLALIKFSGFNQLNYDAEDALLLGDGSEVKQGRSLCRMGYPFPEFHNFAYDSQADDIVWTEKPANTPAFPIDGIVTRHIANGDGKMYGIEMSTPGLRGQSGGPLFDQNGIIYGMQSSTKHLHLGFDMEKEKIIVNGVAKEINNQPFMHVGQCVHVDIIRNFLDRLKVPYNLDR